jgi:hypothetical protein
MSRHPFVQGFTLLLSKDVQKLAYESGKHCSAWLHRRVTKALKRSLGCSVPYWFVIEEGDEKGELHIHGEIAFVPELRKQVRASLKSAGGKWPPEDKRKQLRFSVKQPTFRWAGYCLKNGLRARPEMRRFFRRYGCEGDRRWVAGFGGKSISASADIREAAIELYRSLPTT